MKHCAILCATAIALLVLCPNSESGYCSPIRERGRNTIFPRLGFELGSSPARKLNVDNPIASSIVASDSGVSDAKLSDFNWLTGSWQGKAFGGDYDEHWTPATGTIMMGVARTVREGKTSHYEALRLEQTPDGIVLTAFLPKDGKFSDGTPFKLTKFANREAVFENPEHDFPTKVIYRRTDDDSLFARIEGLRNGAVTGVDFPLKRIKETR